MSTEETPMDVLVVEDNQPEAELTFEAFSELGNAARVSHVPTGEAALAYLQEECPAGQHYMPNIILLDLNLPGKSGHDVLREIKLDKRLQSIPVIVLSNSNDPADIQRVYEQNGNCYLVKPGTVDQFFDMIKNVFSFWNLCAQVSENRFLNE